MTDSTHTPALSGRELARARRREMSRTGGAKIKAGRSNARAAAPVSATVDHRSSAPQAVVAATSKASARVKPLTGAALSRARRAMLSKGGKSGLASATNAASSVRSSTVAVESKPAAPTQSQATPTASTSTSQVGVKLSGAALSRARRAMLSKGGKSALITPANSDTPVRSNPEPAEPQPSAATSPEACCDACAAGSAEPSVAAESSVANDVSSQALDSLCDIIESSPEGAVDASSSVRDFCRQRRNVLSKKGKRGMPGKAGRDARKSFAKSASSSSLTGKALARLHREERCSVGRGKTEACRPSGRQRAGTAPAKVERGTTLSGQSVSGTQVEQTKKITGAESGACRAITGTEYLGVEQFSNLCSTIPQPAQAKVGFSETTRGQTMSGSNVAASEKVTGAESGDCKSITGSEYLGVEHFKSICSSTNVVRSQQKVIEGRTGKDLLITGADEARDNAVTGSETGSAQNVTGSDYTNTQPKTRTGTAPAKVGFSHTAAGMSISGGESSRTSGITGGEQDACGRVTGSEYMSSERFQSTCGTQPDVTPAKVGVDASRGGMTITGNLVDRDNKVTGNEPGTCQRVTGSQYDSSSRKGFCDQRTTKVHEMHTLHGRPLTGTEVSHSPKLTGDDRGNCSVVTGTEYVSQEGFQQSCPQTPQPSATMTGLSRTWNNQVVSGIQTGHSQRTTGDEQGICKTVTGSDYAAREQVSEFCDASAVTRGEQRLGHHDDVPAMPVSGMTPAMDSRMAGNFQRGMCQSVTGSPYQGHQDRALCNSGRRHHLAQASIAGRQQQPVAPAVNEAAPYRSGFSVASPAKTAWQQRDRQPVHSSVFGINSSITGVVNKAQGIISGTPEFRHQQGMNTVPAMETLDAQREGITGEGSEAGTRITGDDWSRGGSITGTEGMFSARRNQTLRGGETVEHNKIGAHALRDREPMEISPSKVTGSSGGTSKTSAMVTLSGGACG